MIHYYYYSYVTKKRNHDDIQCSSLLLFCVALFNPSPWVVVPAGPTTSFILY